MDGVEFTYEYLSRDERRQIVRQLLMERIARQENDHVAASFAVEQIEKGIEDARRELGRLDGEAAAPGGTA